MWLPKTVYESIPFYYIGLGAVALGAAFFIDRWYWAEIAAGAGLMGLVIGIMLVLRRKGYRASRSRLDFDSTN